MIHRSNLLVNMKCVYGCIVAVVMVLLSRVKAFHHCASNHGRELPVITTAPGILNMSSKNYAEDSTCEWLLIAPSPQYNIKVTITYLKTECSWDRLYLYDGRSFRDKLLGVYSGTLLPRPVYATSGAMLVYFFSDYSGVYDGFNLQFSLVSNSSMGTCYDDTQCQSASRNSICDRKTSRCKCETGTTDVYCMGRTTSWQLMSVDTPAVSRTGHKVAYLLDAVYLYGGYDYTPTTAPSHLYRSRDMVNFEVVPATDSPAGRYSHQMVAQTEDLTLFTDYGIASGSETFGEDALFVHGGMFYNGSITDELWTYNVYTTKWSRLSPSPLPLADHVMVVVDNRWLFIHGGRTDTTEDNPVSDMYVYDSKEGTWSKVKYHQGYEPSLRLAGHTAVHHNYLLYIYGGYTQRNARFQRVSDRLWKYDIRRRVWSKLLLADTGLSRQKLVFHAAALYGNIMYIYGGKTESLSQCTNDQVYAFDLNCQEWLQTQENNASGLHRSLGQHGHDMLVVSYGEVERLYVYGGVQGSLTKDVIAIDTSSLEVQSMRRQCDPCSAQTTCTSCVFTNRCHWCAAERSCRNANSMCDDIYWGENSPLSNLSSCQTSDIPAGWFYFIYKYPANHSQPDEAHLSTVSKIEWELSHQDNVCPNCESQLIARGHFYESSESSTSELMFTARRNRASMYSVGTDGKEVLLNEVSLSTAEMTEPVSRNNFLFGSVSGHIMYKAYQVPIVGQRPTAVVGLVGSFKEFSLECLKPYSSGNCSLHTNCLTCSADPLCGWCDSQSQCLIRTSDCNKGSDWLFTEPVYCSNCTSYTNCLSCTESNANCEWLTNIHQCVRRGRSDVSIRTPQSCHRPCMQRTNCTSCLETVDECIWCTMQSTCLPMDSYQLDYQYGECLHYQSSAGQADNSPSSSDDLGKCVDCSKLTTCQKCSDGFFCGWCSHNANPSIGICIPGDFSGPHNGRMCPEAIEATHGEVGEASWSFRTCPDLLECSLGTHDCVQNADCIETLHSYECQCSRGYTGVGNVSCDETCYHQCIHGNCIFSNDTGKAEFRCSCELGWTGDDCDSDCQCNFHSTCERGVGLCDDCQHYTKGDQCEACVANSYGNPFYPSGCTPCQCNGHGHPAGHCDPVTGVCDCVHMTSGDQCEHCMSGFYGDPRDGGECFRCYYGRMLVTNITSGDNYGSRHCHKGVEQSGTSTFQWIFRADNFSGTSKEDNFSIVFVLVALDQRDPKPVYILDHEPNSLLSVSGALAILTKKDIGIAVSSTTGVLVVVHYAEASSDEAMLKFRVGKRGCPHSCTGNSSLCSLDNSCVCSPGYMGADCQTKLDCVTQANSSYCGVTTKHVTARTKAAVSENSMAMYIHGGVTAGGNVLDTLLLVSKDSLTLSSPPVTGVVPSARYGHAMECTVNSCYMYGGITKSSTGSLPLHQYKLASGHSLYISSQFFHLSLNSTPMQWTQIDNKVVPALTGHTLTSVSRSNQVQLVIIGGMSEEVVWNPNVYVYNNSKWYLLATTGARPQGLVGHSTAYRPSVKALYVLPGYTPDESTDLEKSFYILNVASSVWSRRLYSLAPRTSHFLFLVSDRYLAMIGGYYSDTDAVSDKAVDSRSTIYVYDMACDTWHTWWSPTSLTGSIDREIIIGYGYIEAATSMEGTLLVVSSDDTSTVVSTATLRQDFCVVKPDGTLQPSGDLCNPVTSQLKCSGDPMYCEAIDNCNMCISTLPDYDHQPSVCVWSASQGSCIRRGSVAVDEQDKCTSDRCRIHSSCLSCTRTPTCQWMSDADHLQYASCLPAATKLHYISSSNECPVMSPSLTCQSCLSNDHKLSQLTFSHISASYLWHLNQQYCMVTDLAAILDLSHMGNVVSSSRSCLKDCSTYTQCITCQSQPHCGWCSVVESPLGAGLCMEGTRNSSSQCVVETLRHGLEMEVENAMWSYASCPKENECINNHHTCDLTIQRCVDQLIGFTCECKEGYRPISLITDAQRMQLCSNSRSLPAEDPDGGAICVPICQDGCGEHGCCLDDNVCQCNLGYVGDQCEQQCECNGHSYCPANDLSSCTQCLHNTTGDSCDSCLLEYVGDPIAGEDCVSCFDTCNRKSSRCENSKATGTARHYHITLDNVKCMNCTDNSEGNQCEHCKLGYFNNENNTCTPCVCNGHGESGYCNSETGADCVCRNNTMSSGDKYNTQCDSCLREYAGTPINNHQCYYRIVSLPDMVWLDNTSSTDRNPLANGQASYYVLKLLTGKRADVRLTFDLTQGAAEIYITKSDSTFIVTYDPVLDEHVVTFNQSDEAPASNRLTKYRRRRSSSEDSVFIPSYVEVDEQDTEGRYATYHRFDKVKSLSSNSALSTEKVLKLTNVRYRAVVIIPVNGIDIEQYYILVKSRETYTAGALRFTQYEPKIEIFAFINIFASGLLLFLSAVVIGKKMRELHLIRQLRVVREVQLNAMAHRPFSTTIMCMDVDSQHLGGARNVPFNVVPLALEPIRNSSAVVATTFMLLPGDETRPMKAAMASTLVTYRISFPPATKSKARTLTENAEDAETVL